MPQSSHVLKIDDQGQGIVSSRCWPRSYAPLWCALVTGCDVNQRDRFGKAALHYACGHGDVTCMHLLLKGGADIDLRDEVGRSALWLSATEEGQIEVYQTPMENNLTITQHRIPQFYSRTDNIYSQYMLIRNDCS